jgi:phosphoenolpyruvate carboxylase
MVKALSVKESVRRKYQRWEEEKKAKSADEELSQWRQMWWQLDSWLSHPPLQLTKEELAMVKAIKGVCENLHAKYIEGK